MKIREQWVTEAKQWIDIYIYIYDKKWRQWRNLE